jgi:Transposase DDE domain
MTVTDYLLHLFYRIDTELKAPDLPRLRERGPAPTLADSEVITIELAGEFFGLDTDDGIFAFFRRYHLAEFPALATVDRTTFARQAANLWRVKQLLHRRLLASLPLGDPALDGEVVWLIDSFPLRTCKLRRVPGSKLFRGQADFGHDPTAGRDLFYGFRVHLRACDRGFCAQVELTPASCADLPAAPALAPALAPSPADQRRWGPCIGDRNYWPGAGSTGPLQDTPMVLLAPFKKKSSDPDPSRSALLARLRQIIEPVIGQLATRFHAQRTWARDLWHLCSRLTRKLLSHTAAVLLNLQQGNPPLQLDLLLDK